MKENANSTDVEKIPDQHRIDLIRKLRNDLIAAFLNDQNLRTYFKVQYSVSEISAVRIEFIKKELQGLLITPVDLVHYASILIEMKQAGTASLTGKNENLFYE